MLAEGDRVRVHRGGIAPPPDTRRPSPGIPAAMSGVADRMEINMPSSAPRSEVACAYCGSAPAVDDEHVFPRSWYPDTTPSTVKRVTVPACRSCNVRFKAIEE